MRIYDNRKSGYTCIAKLNIGDIFEYNGLYCLLVDFKGNDKITATYFNLNTNCLGTVTPDLMYKQIIKPIYDVDLVLRN